MRIIAGEMRSRTLLAPKGTDTRPTLDRTRESLFNILAAECPGSRVLDLYAGSGALALEALSRGAAFAVIVDRSRQAMQAIERNARNVLKQDFEYRVSILGTDYRSAIGALEGRIFDLVFLDWVLLQKTRFFQHYYPETEGCKGYHDYFYHFKGFLIGCIYTLVMSFVISGIDYLLLTFVVK